MRPDVDIETGEGAAELPATFTQSGCVDCGASAGATAKGMEPGRLGSGDPME